MFQKLNFSFKFVLFLLIALGAGFFVYNNSNDAFAETYKCDTPEEKAKCTSLLSQTEKEISDLNNQLTSTKNEGASLKRDKAILDLQIKQSQLKIKAHELTIANLGKDIVVKTKTIATLDSKIEAGKESLAQILRKTREFDSLSLPEFFLGTDDLSKSFADLDSFASIQDSLHSKFTELSESIKANEEAKENLSKKRNEVIDTKVSAEEQKKKIEKNEAEKAKLIALNNATQSSYQKVIADKAAKVAEIKAALFKLRDAAAITFNTALTYANEVSKSTGVRPAFLLAIITQESNLGANVGSCYVTDLTTGDGKGKNSGTFFEKVMKPPRDTVPFETITKSVGREWSTTPVSCPIGGTAYYVGRGFGGAMGPAQFIPSTWQLSASRVAKLLDIDTADPWNPEHAFMASGLYLADLGGINGSYTGEIGAACRYYGSGGIACTYGKQVMAKAAGIQANIDILNGN